MEDRGSDKFIDGLVNQARDFSDDDLKHLLKSIHIDGAVLVDWFPRGIPRPDTIHGRVQVEAKLAGKLVDTLLAHEKFRFQLDVFPIGIPRPELKNAAQHLVQIDFSSRARR